MITLTAKIQAAEGNEQELEVVLRELVKATATEDGSVEYRLHRVVDTPGAFRFIEKFKDQEAFDFHANSDHFKAAIGKIGALSAGEGELEMLELIDSIPE
ncbi:putative quinol monooxygenase [Maridesulfovibrio salexigens]|uniref:Antibiotic biosynthesis monooxygenase n=1 Tax=Maridesulfovibrio salexigens (strain ATCC 14822 / DSM 2638 / NCIMB 8403 / VKM B-1763) TaxID=526222 RepID=C6BZW1_MARSD|nr:putative quinol monooxygenase [Maridesulfovibrio salexigens]ACS79018.1 Antibiotic biosynthesis monooxygenase [Maridesulfovibrio salexigens DSM 2638]